MQVNNQRVKGDLEKAGEIAEVFQRMRHTIQRNDGTRSFEWITDTCHDQQVPFTKDKETRIAITSTQHMISDMSKGFLTVKVQGDFKLQGINASKFEDPKNLCKFFVGLRDSNELFRQIQIWVNGHSIGYNQQEGIREGFAYSTCKGYAETKTKRFIHSLYENVMKYSDSVCGAYANINDFKDGKTHPIEWTCNIPFDDLLVLQAFDLFPNFAIPNVELRVYVDSDGFVWCPIDPHYIYDVKTLLQEEEINFELPPVVKYTHQFTQINNSCIMPVEFEVDVSGDKPVCKITEGEATLFTVGLTVSNFESHMAGFGICAQSMQSILQELQNGIDIPAQMLTYDSFPKAATERGIQSSVRTTLSNCTNLSVVFPKNPNDMTVFENPMYDNLQLRIDNKNYPDKSLSTIGAEFLQMQLIASDLDGPIQCTQEFEDSYTQSKNAADGTRFKNTLRDCSRFMWNMQLERSGGGYFFDGYESRGKNISVELVGNPIYNGAQDTYYNVDVAGTIHPIPPQLWSCCDCYIKLVPGDMIFYNYGEPEYSQLDPNNRPPEK